jgi:S-layer family protein
MAPLHLPEGALVSVIELSACDTNVNYDLNAYFSAVLKTGGNVPSPGRAGTTLSPGCVVVSNSSGSFTPWTVNNDTTYYTVVADFGSASDTSVVLNSVRVGYRLQISPDPATATFTDVPVGHPLHRFVEALYASGITAGCGGGNYCPDAPVTRGQMAVFLAGALGLHWAP